MPSEIGDRTMWRLDHFIILLLSQITPELCWIEEKYANFKKTKFTEIFEKIHETQAHTSKVRSKFYKGKMYSP